MSSSIAQPPPDRQPASRGGIFDPPDESWRDTAPTVFTDCGGCEQLVSADVGVVIPANGGPHRHVMAVCLTCGRRNGRGHEWVARNNLDIAALPIIADYREHVCSVDGCDEVGCDEHHFAVRALFTSAGHADLVDRYPRAWLCHKHHMLWHDIITPGLLRGRRAA